MKNPALRQEARYEPAAVIPVIQDSSLLDWLEANGRLIYRENKEIEPQANEDEEISELIEVDDHYNEDDDDFSNLDSDD